MRPLPPTRSRNKAFIFACPLPGRKLRTVICITSTRRFRRWLSTLRTLSSSSETAAPRKLPWTCKICRSWKICPPRLLPLPSKQQLGGQFPPRISADQLLAHSCQPNPATQHLKPQRVVIYQAGCRILSVVESMVYLIVEMVSHKKTHKIEIKSLDLQCGSLEKKCPNLKNNQWPVHPVTPPEV